MIPKVGVGCTVHGCGPAVGTMPSSTLFHWTTASVDPAAESAFEEALYTNSAAHMSASEARDRSIEFSFDCVFVLAIAGRARHPPQAVPLLWRLRHRRVYSTLVGGERFSLRGSTKPKSACLPRNYPWTCGRQSLISNRSVSSIPIQQHLG